MMTPPLSIWARPDFVAQVEVSTGMWVRVLRVAFARGRPAGWPRGPRPFEPGRRGVARGLSHALLGRRAARPTTAPHAAPTSPRGVVSADRSLLRAPDAGTR